MKFLHTLVLLGVTVAGLVHAIANDWPRFRGPNRSGINTEGLIPPTEWDASTNMKWKSIFQVQGMLVPSSLVSMYT